MKLRFRIRSLMVAVAVVALIFAYGVSVAKKYHRYAFFIEVCWEEEVYWDNDEKQWEVWLSNELKVIEKWKTENVALADLSREDMAFYAKQLEFARMMKEQNRSMRMKCWRKICNPFAK